MKKFIFMALALATAAVVFTGCKKDEEKATVTIAGNGFNIDQTIDVTAATLTTTSVKVDIAASEGIENLLVDITTSSDAFNAALQAEAMGGGALAGEFDLANPGALATLFTGLKLQNGADVKGKTTLTFDISSFVPVMGAFLTAGDFTADFKITVKDPAGTSAFKTVKMSFKAQ